MAFFFHIRWRTHGLFSAKGWVVETEVMLSPFSPYRAVDGPTQRPAKMWEFARFSAFNAGRRRQRDTVDGRRNPKQPPGMVKNPINNGIIMILGGRRISAINSINGYWNNNWGVPWYNSG